MKEKIRILLADDNTEFVSTVIEYLKQEEDMEVIGTAKDGLEAFEIYEQTKRHNGRIKEQEYITRADDPELWSELEHLTAETEKALKTLIL